MTNQDKEREELEALVEENRSAFDRARRLLSAMKQRTQNEPDRIPPVATEAAARISSQPVPITGGDAKLSPASCWLDLKQLASVELGAKELPTEFASCALSQDSAKAWRPQVPGPQTIRLVFAVPQSIDKIRLVFVEEELERTHEFVLRW